MAVRASRSVPAGSPSGQAEVSRPRLSQSVKRATRTAVTILVLAIAYLLAFELRFEFEVPAVHRQLAWTTLPFVVGLKLLLLRALRAHRHSWQFTSLWDVVAITAAMAAAALIMAGSRLVLVELFMMAGRGPAVVLPFGVVAADLALSIVGTVGIRALRRLQVEERETRRLRAGATSGGRSTRRRRRVLLIGAGRAGGMIAREIQSRPDLDLHAVGFVDDDQAKQRQVIHGLEVLGASGDLPDIVDEQQIDEAIITIADPPGEAVRRLTDICRDAGIDAKIIPGVFEILGGMVNLSRLRPVRIEDLLRRDPVELDTSSIAGLVADTVVLVTGAGGSIGSELCRQLLRFSPRELVLVDQAEGALWAIHRELEALDTGVEVVPAIADVCDATRIRRLVRGHQPTLVFHAAAHKHVPMMETNPGEAVKNNVVGTRTVVDACADLGVGRFVLVSTDKAVNPTSVMGATKRIAERYVQHRANELGRAFVSVRFGNVLGSTGSVVPVFEQQIADGGPVKVTDPEMRRYFMTIPEASQLVVQAGAIGAGGEVFVLDMGEPVRIVDLARDLIRLTGLEPDVDIPIEFTGVRPGEKLFEELALGSEHTDRTTHPSIFVSAATDPEWATIDDDLARLAEVADDAEADDVRAVLARLVPEMADDETRTTPEPPAQPSPPPTGELVRPLDSA